MRNVEIKARVRDLERLRRLAAEVSGSPGQEIHMVDTFFPASNGRLKLRRKRGGECELIQYDRADTSGPKLSNFQKVVLEERTADQLAEALSAALGVRGLVEKTRYLYLVGPTRIHVDRVTGLGDFMELEVALTDDQTTDDGQKIAEQLMKQLEVNSDDLIDCAYMDMLEKQ